MINRNLFLELEKNLQDKHINVILGPRQIGKTTLINQLSKKINSQKNQNIKIAYLNFDDPTLRSELIQNPSRLFSILENIFGEPLSALQEKKYVFIDEAQKIPESFNAIKMIYDNHSEKIKIILTGSSSLNLLKKSAETLAGRAFLYHMHPLSWKEALTYRLSAPKESTINTITNGQVAKNDLLKIQSRFYSIKDQVAFYFNQYLSSGGLPEIFLSQDNEFKNTALNNYIRLYLEQDIRLLPQIRDESLFIRTLQSIIRSTSQILNISGLASQIGVQRPTIENYLDILKETFIINLHQPFVRASGQARKNPKSYFFDHALYLFFNKIFSADQLEISELRGAALETLIVNELSRHFSNNPCSPHTYYWRDYQGHEIDIILENRNKIIPIEITCSKSNAKDKLKNFNAFYKIFPKAENGIIIWGGDITEFSIGSKQIFAIPYWLWF